MPTLIAQEADLADLSLEELANLEITSVSRRPENLSTAAASIFVITAEDIRRSGASTIPEILRLAPNLQVARRDSVQYAITARGFNNTIGSKLLVLMDGRTLYTPLFSGVFWDMQGSMLEDIDRVEVISGPGATLWGANAVNGVINIITKNSSETRGTLIAGEAGNTDRSVSLRAGGNIGPNTSFRAYGKLKDWDNTHLADDADVADEWKRAHAGFRADWSGTDQNFTIQGDIFKGESEPRGFIAGTEIPRLKILGKNLLARWTRHLNSDSNVYVQAYWSHSVHHDFLTFQPEEDIYDLEAHHNFSSGIHKVLWGGGYRMGRDEIDPGRVTVVIPDSRKLNWGNLFVQDEIQLLERVKATVGIKLERNEYTGWEYLPSARLAWTPTDTRLLWTAVTRAVRAPSRFDREFFFPQAPPFLVMGGPDFESEVSNVFEIGYRERPLDRLNYSLTLFYHDWDNLRSGSPLPLPVFIVNNIEGEVYGMEGWASWQVTPYWRMGGGVTALRKDLKFKPGFTESSGNTNPDLDHDPDYQWMLRSSIDLLADIQLDLQLRRVDSLTVQSVPYYTEMNINLAWLPWDNVEISITGRDLLHDDHPEFGAATTRSEIDRSVLLGFKWAF